MVMMVMSVGHGQNKRVSPQKVNRHTARGVSGSLRQAVAPPSDRPAAAVSLGLKYLWGSGGKAPGGSPRRKARRSILSQPRSQPNMSEVIPAYQPMLSS